VTSVGADEWSFAFCCLLKGVMLDSMFASMTTSMQLAQECLRQEPTEGEQVAEAAQPFEGLEVFAQTIEAG
jgi:autophagy-related protein 2